MQHTISSFQLHADVERVFIGIVQSTQWIRDAVIQFRLNGKRNAECAVILRCYFSVEFHLIKKNQRIYFPQTRLFHSYSVFIRRKVKTRIPSIYPRYSNEISTVSPGFCYEKDCKNPTEKSPELHTNFATVTTSHSSFKSNSTEFFILPAVRVGVASSNFCT